MVRWFAYMLVLCAFSSGGALFFQVVFRQGSMVTRSVLFGVLAVSAVFGFALLSLMWLIPSLSM